MMQALAEIHRLPKLYQKSRVRPQANHASSGSVRFAPFPSRPNGSHPRIVCSFLFTSPTARPPDGLFDVSLEILREAKRFSGDKNTGNGTQVLVRQGIVLCEVSLFRYISHISKNGTHFDLQYKTNDAEVVRVAFEKYSPGGLPVVLLRTC